MVIDASGLYYRTLYTVTGYGASKGEKMLDSKKSQGIFMRKLATDFSSLVRALDEPCRVVVCLDSTSWRKSVEIEEYGYKSNREKSESTVNWNAFYEMTQNFSAILSQKGYIVSKVPGAEADDLLFLWSRKLNGMGENVLMVTGDRDMYQVLTCNTNGTWTISLDPNLERRKISLTQETLNFRETQKPQVDIFDTESWNTSEDLLHKVISGYNLNIVDVRKFQVQKVVLGDGGDMVPSVVAWPDKKEPEKIRTMTENNFQKIAAACPGIEEATWQDLQAGSFYEEISSVMEGLKKIEVDREKVKRNLVRNCKLVILSEEIIPAEIQKIFHEEHISVPDLKPAVTRDAILDGTEWWTSEKSFVPKSFDLFGE
jgi:5'-3' exonuclease